MKKTRKLLCAILAVSAMFAKSGKTARQSGADGAAVRD